MNDLISRQAAIDALRASAKKYTGFLDNLEMFDINVCGEYDDGID